MKFGGAKKFLEFITHELKPWVNENYRTHSYSILAGHSFGGLFKIYSMMEQPESFQSYLALSPSLGRNGEQQIEVAKRYFTDKNIVPNTLYVAVGSEGGWTYRSTIKFAEIVSENHADSMRFKFEHLKGENHVSISTQGFIDGLKFINGDINPERLPSLDEIFLIEDHFGVISQRYGHEIKVPEHYYQKVCERADW